MYCYQPPISSHLQELLTQEAKEVSLTKVLSHYSLRNVNAVNNELSRFGIPQLEYAMIFHYPKWYTQVIHVDGVTRANPRNASLNFVISGTNAVFEWFTGKETKVVENDISYLGVEEASEQLLYSEPLAPIHLANTRIPHRVRTTDSEVRLLCLRFHNNPSFDHLKSRFTM